MKQRKNLLWLCLLFGLTLLSACGGSSGNNGPTTTTLKGAVEFPAASASAKATAKLATEKDIAVEVYDLNGKKVATVQPTYDDAQTTRIYSYEVPGLTPKVDYVLKAKKISTGQVVKKLIDKEKVVVGTVEAQKVDPVSTTVVVMAEKKIASTYSLAASAIKLGEENVSLPSTVSAGVISETIRTAVQPSTLENQINTLAAAVTSGNLSSIDSKANADLLNSYLIVNEAIKQKIDAQDFVAGALQVTINVQIIVYTTSPVLAPASSMGSADAATTTSAASDSYTPPAPPTTPTTGLTAAEYVTIAKAYLNKQDIANASINYENAIVADPANKDANFGAAVTKGLMLIENADVKTIITKWGGIAPTVNQVISSTSPLGNPFRNMTSAVSGATSTTPLAKTAAKTAAAVSTTKLLLDAFGSLKGKLPQQKITSKTTAKIAALVPATAPSVSEMQTVIDNVIIPAIKTVIERLAKVEGNGYTFTVTKAMQGNPVNGLDVTLNDGEFYTLDAALNGAMTIFKIVMAYNFDVASNDYNALSRDPLVTLNSSTFFTLKADGKAKMAEALAFVKTARDKAELAYSVVKLRTAGQGTFDLTRMSATQKTDFEDILLVKAKAALQGQQTFTRADGKSLTIDVTKFFTNPLDRSKLPTLGYDVQPDATLSAKYNKAVAGERKYSYTDYLGNSITNTYPIDSQIVPKSDLPDYTLNGILPGNTAASNVAGFNGLLPVLDGKLLSDADFGFGYGSTTDGASAYLLAENGQTSTPVTVTDANGYTYTKYTYTYNYIVKKVDLATGAVSKYADLSFSNWVDRLFYYNGAFYVVTMEWKSIPNGSGGYDYVNTLKISPVDTASTTWSIGANPIWQKDLAQNTRLSDITANGTDIYYALNTWNSLTYSSTTEVKKLSNLTTDTTLFTTADYIGRMAFSSGFLFTGDGNLDKRDLTGNVLASYANGGMDIMVSGYFYQFYDGKLIKKAGTPSGAAAKLAGLLGKFF